MYLVVRRGAFDTIARGGELAAAAAVACVREFEHDERFAEAFATWRPRPGKVVLRARSPSQWERVLELPHAGGDGLVALPPRRRSARGDTLTKLQAMSTELEPAPPGADAPLLYALNPAAPMSSGKTLAQIAHAAVMVADAGLATAGAAVIAPDAAAFAAFASDPRLVAEVADAGLTEVAPGTITVRALRTIGRG
jgi:peptidyl-tRNA hydrolase